MKWSFFMRRKSELIEKMMRFIKSQRSKDPESVRYIHLDNAGENLGLKTKIEEEGLNIQMEFTSPETPE
jgi:hypothetical protein